MLSKAPTGDIRISIHTPLAGSDLSNQQTMQLADIFQSTLPLRGVTLHHANHSAIKIISIHTPLAGSDNISVPLIIATSISIHTPLAGSD